MSQRIQNYSTNFIKLAGKTSTTKETSITKTQRFLTNYAEGNNYKTKCMTRKFYFYCAILLLIVSCTPANYDGNPGYMQPVYVGPGIGLGTIIAVVLSWSRNKSILWAIIHGILGWLYVIYVVIVGRKR